MVKRKQTYLIHNHRCKQCGIEIYEEAKILDGRFWVQDFCDICIKKDKIKETALKEVEVEMTAIEFFNWIKKLDKNGLIKDIIKDKKNEKINWIIDSNKNEKRSEKRNM